MIIIFFGSNDLVFGSVVAEREKNIHHQLTARSFIEIAFVITINRKKHLMGIDNKKYSLLI